ncbi:MAG: glycosyltransferase family 2 protein [Marinilabiliaceae bacterium]|nr:glycosyltransferase family 2 protein [Marinilabiliaceae bacterium]
MDLSVIILTHNSINNIDRCLGSLLEDVKYIDHEILLYDNASVDGTVDFVRNKYPSVIITRNNVNMGVAKARNLGLKHAKGNYILILDDDTEVLPNGVSGILNFCLLHPGIGICAPQLLNDDGSIQANALPYPSFAAKLSRILSKLICKTIEYKYHNEVIQKQVFEPDYVIGAAQLIKREVFLQAGYLDESIFYGPEDADFCIRIKQCGWRVVCVPQYSIVHIYQRKSYRFNQFKISVYHALALVHFWNKNGWFRN